MANIRIGVHRNRMIIYMYAAAKRLETYGLDN